MMGRLEGILPLIEDAEHKAHQEDASLRSDEEQGQKAPKTPIISILIKH